MIPTIIALLLPLQPACPPRCATPQPWEPTVVFQLPTKTPTVTPTPRPTKTPTATATGAPVWVVYLPMVVK